MRPLPPGGSSRRPTAAPPGRQFSIANLLFPSATSPSIPITQILFGDGVYKTLDGGKTWRNLGLRDTHHISRIAINPLNTNIAYVAALGHNTGPNEERGVFMTTDGGETWKKVLYIDAEHGCADLDIDVNNPNILYATMWRFDRKPWRFISGSENTGVFRSTDGGRTWKQLTN